MPEKTLIQAEAKLPEKFGVEINERRVSFGGTSAPGRELAMCRLLTMGWPEWSGTKKIARL